ncbi:MAG TPA: C39 family peptidase, partial [Caldilineaceae bacterium]|nr:C39 family peptidase [Caldilineaceae bacterium]
MAIGTLLAAGVGAPRQAADRQEAQPPALGLAANPVERAGPPPWSFREPSVTPLQAAGGQAEPLAQAARQAAAPTPVPTEPPPTATPPPPTPLPPAPTPATVPVQAALPTATATSPLAPSAPVQPLQSTVQLTGFRHQWQTWNNCGPATLSMNLSYYGSPLSQADIGAVLRQFPDDKNVSPYELAGYARSQGFQAQVRANGSADLARQFLSNGIPLLIETWLEEQPNDGMGHYRLLVGFDDANQRWIAYDSYVHTNLVSEDPANYQGIYMPYAEMDSLWKVFNRTYVLIYPPDREPVVRAILGDAFEPAAMWQQALATAQTEAAQNPNDPFAHFNVGTSLVELGDYAGAAAAFDQARAIGLPWRMFWYQFN